MEQVELPIQTDLEGPEVKDAYDILPVLEEDLGISLEGAKLIPQERREVLRKRIAEVRTKILDRYGNYLTQEEKEFLGYAEEITLLVPGREFDRLMDRLVEIDINLSDKSHIKQKLKSFTWKILKTKFKIHGKSWRPGGLPGKDQTIIFIKLPDRTLVDPEYEKAAIAEELLHGFAKVRQITDFHQVPFGKKRYLLYLDEHATKRYALPLVRDGEEVLQSEGNFWRECESEFGEHELKQLFFRGESKTVNIQDLLERAAKQHLQYPNYP